MSLSDFMMNAGNVKRFHTHTIIGENTVAHHSWGVCVLILELVGPDPSVKSILTVDLLRAALFHDAFEVITGDVPYTAKRKSPQLKAVLDTMEKAEALEVNITFNLHPWEEHVLKFADILDLTWFCVKQRRLGNNDIEEIFNTGVSVLVGNIDEMRIYPETINLIDRATEMYHECATEFYA